MYTLLGMYVFVSVCMKCGMWRMAVLVSCSIRNDSTTLVKPSLLEISKLCVSRIEQQQQQQRWPMWKTFIQPNTHTLTSIRLRTRIHSYTLRSAIILRYVFHTQHSSTQSSPSLFCWACYEVRARVARANIAYKDHFLSTLKSYLGRLNILRCLCRIEKLLSSQRAHQLCQIYSTHHCKQCFEID